MDEDDHGKFRLERVKPNQVEFVVEGIKLHILGLITFVSSHLGIDEAEARGARGGYRGGYRAARTTSVRYGQRVRQRVRVRYNGGYRSYRFGGGYSWQMAAAGGALYGYSTYSRRRMYRDYPGRGEGKVESYSYRIDIVFTSYSYRIHIVFTSYSHRIHIVLTPCSNRIHSVFTSYSHRIHNVFISYLHRIYTVLSSYSHRINIVFKSFSQCIHIVFTSYLYRIHIRFTSYLHGILFVFTSYDHRVHMVFTSCSHRIHIIFLFTLLLLLFTLLQYIKEPLIEAITITLNQSLNTGIFPEKLKIAKVIQIHKKEDPSLFRKLPTDFNFTIYL